MHADCRLRPGTFQRIIKEINRRPFYIGGALGMSYDSRCLKNCFLEGLNNFRARWVGISFGDQGQFFRKEALGMIGGYPNQMIMEDVELSLRLRENGATKYIPRGIVVSQRRWERIGFIKNFCKVVRLCLRYLVQRRLGMGHEDMKNFYKSYYGSP